MSDNFTKMVNNKWIQDGWKAKVGDWYAYIDIVCGHPVYQIKESNLRDMHKTDAMKGQYCPLCRYAYDSFGEIMAMTKMGKRDGLTGFFIWLPTIEQLMRMVRIHHDCTRHSTRFAFWRWYLVESNALNEMGSELELWTDQELWLAFVMFELFSRRWAGERWTP